MKLEKEIAKHITSAGLDKSFPADSKHLQAVVSMATVLAESGKTASSEDPARVPKVCHYPRTAGAPGSNIGSV